jgi:DNA-binding Xre family transcriptional regulator
MRYDISEVMRERVKESVKTELSEATGISYHRLTKFANGDDILFRELMALVRHFGYSLAVFRTDQLGVWLLIRDHVH